MKPLVPESTGQYLCGYMKHLVHIDRVSAKHYHTDSLINVIEECFTFTLHLKTGLEISYIL